MTRRPSAQLPSLRLHRPTGQAVVTLANPRGKRRDYYLGRFGSEAATEAYHRLVARWLDAQRELPPARLQLAGEVERVVDVAALVDRYMDHAEVYYRRLDGTPTGEAANIRRAGVLLCERFGHCHPAEITPSRLRQFRDGLIERGLSRTYINSLLARVRLVFRWAEARELLPAGTFHRLQTVEHLQAGRSKARETPGLSPVSREEVDAVLPHLGPQVAAIVEVLWLTGARCGEIVQLARRHVDMTGTVWLFRPPQHKNRHRGKDRVIPIGPAAQAVLHRFVRLAPDQRWFRPCDAVEDHRARRRADRKTPLWPSHLRAKAAQRKANPQRPAGDAYDTRTVAHAIRRACTAAGLERPWTPHRLRHAALSRVRQQLGLEAAAAIGGHSQYSVTEAYSTAAREALARRVMAELG